MKSIGTQQVIWNRNILVFTIIGGIRYMIAVKSIEAMRGQSSLKF